MIPSVLYVNTPSPGEGKVFKLLERDPNTDDWVVLHSLDIVAHKTKMRGEIDFLVIIPSKGVLVVEIKAHKRIAFRDGMWYLGHDPPSTRGPFRQVNEAMHSIKQNVQNRFPGLKSVPFGTCVIFTETEFKESSPEWHDWEIVDSSKLSRPISDLLLNVIDYWRDKFARPPGGWLSPESNEPTNEQIKVLINFLRPNFETYESPRAQAKKRAEEVKYYTEVQYGAIDSMSTNKRVIFQGPAGTGKTMLAIEAARRAVSLGRRVLFLCFNNLLGDWLKNETEPLGPAVKTTTLHKYLLDLADIKENTDLSNATFWSSDLPSKAMEALIESNEDRQLFDELIIDEAQDILRPNYLDILDLSLRNGLSGGRWRIFGDFEKQAIYTAASLTLEEVLESRLPGSFVYSLRDNCRNSPRVAELVHLLGGLDPKYLRVLRPDDGYQPTPFYYSSPAQQQEILITQIGALDGEGFEPNDIVILSPKKGSECAAAKINVSPWKERVRPISMASAKQIPFTSIHAFKGREAGAVIVTDIDRIAGDLFYIAITRALHRLVLLISADAKTEVIDILLSKAKSAI